MMLPSKKVLSFLILTVALVASIIIGFGRDKGSSAINLAQNLVAGEKISIPGNPNWQNELGTIATNTEPVAPNQKGTEPQTSTDAVSTSLVSNYLALKQNGTLNQKSAQKLVDQSVDYIVTTGATITKIFELNKIPDNGVKSITEYGENLGNMLRKNKPKTFKNELEIISSAVQSANQSKMDELDSVIVVYESIANELKKMPVPQISVKAHLDMTNGAIGLAMGLREMKKVLSDPFKGILAMQLYQDNVLIFTRSMKATLDFIKQNKIVYKQGSGGYYLLYGI